MAVTDQGWLEVTKLLLLGGPDVNTADKNGGTALMGASDKDYLEEARLLLDTGADVNSKDNDGYTTLMWAASSGHVKVVKLPWRGALTLMQRPRVGGQL
jgi:uncharacterized protein